MRLASSSSASVSVAVVTNSIEEVSRDHPGDAVRMRPGPAHRSRRGPSGCLRLAHIEHVALAIEHAIDAGRVRQGPPEMLDDLGAALDRVRIGLEVELHIRAALERNDVLVFVLARISGGTSLVGLRLMGVI